MLSVVEYRRVLAEVARSASSDVAVLLRDASDGMVAREILEVALPEVVNTYGSAAASVSADWYEDVRVASGAPGRFRARVPGAVPAEQARILARWGIDPLFSKTPDWVAALQLLDGGVQRLVTNQARKAVMDSAREDAAAQGWQRMAGGDACGFCRMLADRGAVYSKETVDFGAHDSCFPAGVVASGPPVEAGFRRWYQGELVVIRTAGGHELPVTPNHPVLTPSGWVAASEVRVGHQVFESTHSDLAHLGIPDEKQMPSLVEDIWGAPGMDLFRSVPVAAEDFHGDRGQVQGNVDVVAPHSFLASVGYPGLVEHGAQGVRAGAGASAVLDPLSSFGDSFSPLAGLGLPSDGLVCMCRSLFALGGAERGHVDQPGLPGVSRGKARLAEPTENGRSGDPVSLRHRQDALAGFVGLAKVRRRGEPVMAGHAVMGRPSDDTAAGLEGVSDAVAGTPDDGRDLIERLSGGVKALGVVEVGVRNFAGHVYNFQTTEGWYTANSLVVHNCGCVAVPEFGGDVLDMRRYRPSTRGIPQADKDRAKAWMREHGYL